MGGSWGHLGASWDHLGASSTILEHLGRILGASWVHLGASWKHLGASWGHLWASWEHLRGILEASWKNLGSSLQKTSKILKNRWFFSMVFGPQEKPDSTRNGKRRLSFAVLGYASIFFDMFGNAWLCLAHALCSLRSLRSGR